MTPRRWKLRLTPFRGALLAMTAVFVALALYRLFFGLGAATHLNDQWPWGLWIGVDLTAVALAGAGYSMCLLAHVLHIKDFRAVSRRAMLLSLLGYVFVLGTLILEVGRWDNVHRPLISWGHHSPMFEVYVAITFYMVIQIIELGDVVTETVLQPLRRFLRPLLPAVFVLGALLPFGHQASLGAIYLLMEGKLHPLWWSPMLPWFFLMTSFYAGPAVILLETLWSSRAYGCPLEARIQQRLARLSASLMVLYFVWKLVDLAGRGALYLAFTGSSEAMMLWLEMGAGVMLPAVIAFTPWVKRRAGLLAFSLLGILGVVLSRVNVVFTGMVRALGSGYHPSWMEWGITLGLLSAIVLAYLFMVENLPIFEERPSADSLEAVASQAIPDRRGRSRRQKAIGSCRDT